MTLSKSDRQENRAKSQRQERRAARDMGLKPTAGSGSQTVKNDARADRDGRAYPESVEFKTTGGVSYRLLLDDLIKAARHAAGDQRTMLFGIEFQNARGGPPWQYVLMEHSDYTELITRVRQLEAQYYQLQDECIMLRGELSEHENS